MSRTEPADPRARRIGTAMALGAAVLFSMKAVLVKIGLANGTPTTDMLVMRMALAAPIFAVVASRPGPQPLSRADLTRLFALGLVGYHLSAWLDFKGMEYISAGLERLVLYAHPTLVVLFGAAWRRERPRGEDLRAIAICYVGLLIAIGGDVGHGAARDVAIGASLVFGCACLYAVYLLSTEALAPRIGAARIGASATLVSAFTLGVHAAVAGRIPAIADHPPIAWGLASALALGSTVFPVLLLAGAVARIGPEKASTLGMIGPPAAAVLGWTFLGEPLGPLQLLGGAIVLVGAGLSRR